MSTPTVSLENTAVVADLRQVFDTGRTRPLSWRLDQLHGVEGLFTERECDIAPTTAEARYVRKHLRRRRRPRRIRLPLNQLPARGRVQYDPLGVAMVIGPRNYSDKAQAILRRVF